MKYSADFLERAHKASSLYKEQLLSSEMCGCFHCLKVYSPKEIKDWIEESNDLETAICRHCDIDSVIAASSGLPIDDETFLKKMYDYWFS